jgi:GNAT-family acetyltransferase (TIGR03103 family)
MNMNESALREAVAPAQAASVDCGWGKVLFGRTFARRRELVEALLAERADERDIAYNVPEPHVTVAMAPQDLFVDPSYTYRLDLAASARAGAGGIRVRRATAADEPAVNRIYAARRMVPLRAGFLAGLDRATGVTVLVALNPADDAVVGVVMGIRHGAVFDDPERGASLWSLAVDPNAGCPGIGRALVDELAHGFRVARCAHMDLSVMYDNDEAAKLYESFGFVKREIYCVKKKNTINEPLYIRPEPHEAQLNIYAGIIVTEARRRGIRVSITDAASGIFELSHGGRTIKCRESLSELTSAVALSCCTDKALTSRMLTDAGLHAPAQQLADDAKSVREFLDRHGAVVVKPVDGEQGLGVHVDVSGPAEVESAIEDARQYSPNILIEEFCRGMELRVIVIGGEVVAAAERRPPTIVGDGESNIVTLIEKHSRRRAAATGGESSVPLDDETARCIRAAGHALFDIPHTGAEICVRHTANLHTGGTLHDCTDQLPGAIRAAALKAAEVLGIPVVGIDFIVDPADPERYVIIEANERPGLANHEPQPTAERFVDLLFPETRRSERLA